MNSEARLVTALVGAWITALIASTVPATADKTDGRMTAAKIHPSLRSRASEETRPVKTWVFFTDKGHDTPTDRQNAVVQIAETYNARAKQRRALRSDAARRGLPLFDARDLPVASRYIEAVAATGATTHVKSRWLNAVSVYATADQFEAIAALPFVKKLQPVARSARILPDPNDQPVPINAPPADPRSRIDYGAAYAQLAQINLIDVHNAGYTGEGVIVGILDTGFRRTHEAFNNFVHPLNVVAEYDFVDNDPDAGMEPGDPYSQHDHGTMILGCLGAYKPGSLVGGAYDASFILCKTEDTTGEYPAEEDNYVAGLEFIEANGADLSTASLGYIDWYTQADLDGLTAVTTIAVNILTSRGVHHCNAAGNEYHDSNPSTSSLIAPADAFQGITCGAVSSSGSIASFSSDGPTADGRVKPELLARGVSTHTVSPSSNTNYTTADGTSLSTPVLACAVACLVQAKPHWTVDQMRQHLFETADYYSTYGTHDPQYVRGYGIVNAAAAMNACSDAGEVSVDKPKYACEDTVTIVVNDCGLNTDDNLVETIIVGIESDSEPGVEQVTLTETGPASPEFLGAMSVSTVNANGVLLVADGDTITVTYVDADDGAGGTGVPVSKTVPVDCTPPSISGVHASAVGARSATIACTTDETALLTVHYGMSCSALTQSASGSAWSQTPTVTLRDIIENTTYSYAVEAQDEAGNIALDDNAGACYTFTTPDIPDYFTEELTSGFDLAYHTVTLIPDGSYDYYAGCVEPIAELPTDPAGGTPLALGEDEYATVTLGGGATVSLYGTEYSAFYPGSNGYITFITGDTDYTETLADHFAAPRISAIFNDFSPQNGGATSWKQLADRVAVTWQNVPEYSVGGANTFQVELFYDGTITLSYLNASVSSGIVGVSAGGGLPADFYESDLSALGNCGPQPPVATPAAASTPRGTPVTIALSATDDGLPDPPGALSYIVTTLPTAGDLSDPQTGIIETIPHALTGDAVTYQPHRGAFGPDAFAFRANDGGLPPEGGDSNDATVSVTVTLPPPQTAYDFPLDSDPGWQRQGQWAFGTPSGSGTHNADPLSGYTGANVFGYNLSGDYPNDMTETMYLITPAIDCSLLMATTLEFRRWLGVEDAQFDEAVLQVSTDAINWHDVWKHTGHSISETEWTLRSYDIAEWADANQTVYLRWGMGPTDYSNTYPGWNIDDIRITGVPLPGPGDHDGDGDVDLTDFVALPDCLTGPAAQVPTPACQPFDFDGDADVDAADFGAFQARCAAD